MRESMQAIVGHQKFCAIERSGINRRGALNRESLSFNLHFEHTYAKIRVCKETQTRPGRRVFYFLAKV